MEGYQAKKFLTSFFLKQYLYKICVNIILELTYFRINPFIRIKTMSEIVKIDSTSKGLFARILGRSIILKHLRSFLFFNSVYNKRSRRIKFSSGETWRGLTGSIVGHDTRTKMLGAIRNMREEDDHRMPVTRPSGLGTRPPVFVIGKILDNSISPASDRVDI